MYKTIYSIGCFDYLHEGHINLLKNLKAKCEELIVGIHDDDSLGKLKDLKITEHQNIQTRVANLKKYVDRVFIINDIDPSFHLESIIKDTDNKINSCFIRANDNINFPGKDVIINRISLEFIPYTKGISSTQIRKKNLNN
jgi:cytidyltransferase-like protein